MEKELSDLKAEAKGLRQIIEKSATSSFDNSRNIVLQEDAEADSVLLSVHSVDPHTASKRKTSPSINSRKLKAGFKILHSYFSLDEKKKKEGKRRKSII